MTSRDRDSQSEGQRPDELMLKIGGRIFDAKRNSTGSVVAKVRREIDQSTAVIPSIAEPSNILSFPQRPVSAPPEIVSLPSSLREEYAVALPVRSNFSNGEIPQPQLPERGRQQVYLKRRVFLQGAAAVLVSAVGYKAVEALSRAVAPAIDKSAQGFNDPIGLKPAEETSAKVQSRRNLEAQLNSDRAAAGANSKATLAARERESIKALIKFKEDFAERIDKLHNNPHAGDSHRQEAARLQGLLDK